MDWAANWAQFRALPHTAAADAEARAAWLRGRQRYSAWVLRVAAPAVVARVQAVAHALEPWLRPLAPQDLHLTVWVAGFVDGPGTFPLPDGWVEDSVEGDTLQAQAVALSTGRWPRLRVGSANAFRGCAVLEVDDAEGALGALRSLLLPIGPELRFATYKPHITVGLFHPESPTQAIADALAPLRELPVVPWVSERIERVEWDATRALSPLQTVASVPLGAAA